MDHTFGGILLGYFCRVAPWFTKKATYSKEFILNPVSFGMFWNDLCICIYIYIVLYRILWKVFFFEWWVLLQLSSGDLADVLSILVWCSMGQKWGTWNSFTYFKCIWHEFASNGAIKQWASRHKADGDNNTNNNHRHGTPIPMVEMIWSNDAICAGFAAGFTNGIYMGH